MNKMSSYRRNDIEALSERLGSLQITGKALESTNEQTDIEMSTVLVPVQENNGQARVPKSMVLNSGWFNGDRTKFKDW